MRFWRDQRGFGNHAQSELMFVVSIMGILAAVAVPKFAELIRKSNEGATRGELGVVRTALSIAHDDNEGFYPYHPAALTAGGKYLASLPLAKTPNYHSDSSKVTLIAAPSGLDDAGGWAYLADPASKSYGTFYVNCTHTDTKGSAWSTY